MEHTTARVDVLGRGIHEIRGGAGRPLLYLHSTLGEASWLPHLLRLSERYEVHAPAHPGFLTSEGLEQLRDMEDMARHYAAYLDVMDWETVDVVGLSFGGWIAAELAARYPERVSRLVLVNALGLWIREQPIVDIFRIDTRFPERVTAMLFHDVSVPAARMMPDLADPNVPDEVLIEVFKAFAATAKLGWNPLLHNPKLESLLPRVRARTLCLWSEQDRVVPVAYGRKYASLIPGAALQVIPDCGHLLPLEKSEDFCRAVMEFLD